MAKKSKATGKGNQVQINIDLSKIPKNFVINIGFDPVMTKNIPGRQGMEEVIDLFIKEKCVMGVDYRIKATDLYKDFVDFWRSVSSECIPSLKLFGRSIGSRFPRFRSGNVNYIGLRLR
jgi:hypothetical protein